MAYVYLHKRLDTNEIFYVGIGLTHDPKHKRAYIKGRNKYWKRVVDKAGYKVIILFDNLTPETAKEAEIAWIKYYGRQNLTNGTDGGDGCANPSEETRDKLSYISKGEKNAMFGKSSWPICPVLQYFRKEKLKATSKNRIHSEETKAKMSESAKNRKKQGPMSEEAKVKAKATRIANKLKKDNKL